MALKVAAIVLLIIGLTLGPGYAIYATQLSGNLLASEVLYDQSVTVIPAGPAEFRTRGMAEQSDMTIRLEPAMNPIRLNANYTYRPPRSGLQRRDRYQILIMPETDDPESAPIDTRELEIIHHRDGESDAALSVASGTSSLGLLNVEQATEYHFAIAQPGGGQSSLDVTEISLDIRTNVMPVNFMVVTIGGVLLVAGIGLVVLTAVKGRSSSKY